MTLSTTGPASTSPNQPALGAYDDAMGGIYAVMSQIQSGELANGETEVEENESQEKASEQQQQAALQAAQQDQANSGGGFFSSVGHFFSDIGNDIAHGDFSGALQDAGHDLDQMWNSPAFWNDLEHGLEAVAAVAGAVVTSVATLGAGSGLAAVGVVATITAVTAGAAAGGAAAKVHDFAAAATDDNANATAAGDQAQQTETMTDDALQTVKDDAKSTQRAAGTLDQAIQTNDETVVAPSATVVRG